MATDQLSRKCCGGGRHRGHRTSYGVEPEVINLSITAPFEGSDGLPSPMCAPLRSKPAPPPKPDLTPVVSLLDTIEHKPDLDAGAANLLTNIKQQIISYASAPAAAADRRAELFGRQAPSAFRPATPDSCPASSSADEDALESFEFDGTPEVVMEEDSPAADTSHRMCENIFRPALALWHRLVAARQTDDEHVAVTHNHAASQPCQPDCWAFKSTAHDQTFLVDTAKRQAAPPASYKTTLRIPL